MSNTDFQMLVDLSQRLAQFRITLLRQEHALRVLYDKALAEGSAEGLGIDRIEGALLQHIAMCKKFDMEFIGCSFPEFVDGVIRQNETC